MINYNQLKKILYHTLFWCFILFYDVIAWGTFENNYESNFYVHLLILPFKLLSAYLIAYYAVPFFLVKKKYIPFTFFIVICLVIAGVLQDIMTILLVFPLYNPEALKWIPLFSVSHILIEISQLIPSTGLLSGYVTFQYLFQQQQTSEILAREKLAAELNFLKSQVHPHFLFNTLNNLYALTLKNAIESSEVVLKLSALLNYMLYESSVQFVALEKELQSIKNYLSLEQIRYGKRLEVIFNINGSVANFYIAPLLLIPLIENCFKHGAVREIEGGWIDIDVTVKEEILILKIENSKPETCSIISDKSGIGLTNVKRRLDIIYGEYSEMKIFDESDRFMVVLKLNRQSPTNKI